MKRVALLLVLVAVLMCQCAGQHRETLVIFHAGSLSKPMNELAKKFEEYMKKKGVNVVVHLEASGSVDAIRKIIDLGRRADIIAVADYQLLKKMMYPKYISFYIGFARNEVVLAYTNKSKYANEINSSNWYEILMKKGVTFGFSNPNRDPCGYRALMVMRLADMYYGKKIFENLVEKHSNIRIVNGTIVVPENIVTDSKIVIRPKSVALLGLLESGAIDYAFEYKSVAEQHGLRFVQLPDEINLGNPKMANIYKKVKVKIDHKIIVGEPIVYGVSIPKNAEHKKLALEFLRFMLGKVGREVFKENYQEILKKPIICGKAPKI